MERTENKFINVTFSLNNLDNYFIRHSIFCALKNNLPLFQGKLLDVGCGKMPYKDYILNNSSVEKYYGLDIETAIEYDKDVKPDFFWNGREMPFDNNTYDTVILTEVLEHCPNPLATLKEINRVMKPNGTIFFTVPFLWPLHEMPHDYYRYTPTALQLLLEESKFTSIIISASGGWDASLAQMLGLWVRRSNLSMKKKKYFSFLFKPIISYLLKRGNTQTNFREGLMVTSLYGTAKK
jgi:Methylase involved in ubiquinone/menaquinone biosynthesis